MNSPDKLPINLWDKWLKATGVNGGYGYRVPEEVWDAAWNGNWPDDEESIRWILEEYLDVETAKAHGYLELVLPLRETAQAALNAAKSEGEEQKRQIKIDADIDEVIKTIQGLGLKPDEKTATDRCGQNPSSRRNRWMRSAVMTITIFAIGAFAGFVGAYNLHAPNGAGEIRISRSPEIRRAIPVEPEIRRAIPVQSKDRSRGRLPLRERDGK
jgi:hypothetical protein